MNPTTDRNDRQSTPLDPAVVVRRAVDTLNSLDPEVSGHLNALAFVLMRVARADGRVCTDERDRMEKILTTDAGVSPEHAVLVTEIACHRTSLADCGSTYAISRGLRSALTLDRRESIIALLSAVARADGVFLNVERREILQIAGEVGIDPSELAELPASS